MLPLINLILKEIVMNDEQIKSPPNWPDIFPNGNPIELELGCGRPSYILEKAQLHPETNFIGMEYKPNWVSRAQKKAEKLGLKNIYMMCANARDTVPWAIPDGSVDQITIQFPDPWFKRRHFKRRLLDQAFSHLLAQKMKNGGQIFLQTDVKNLFDLYLSLLEACPVLENMAGTGTPIGENPMTVRSHRETKCIAKILPVYRLLLKKI